MEYRVPITGSRSVTQTAYRVDKNKAAHNLCAPSAAIYRRASCRVFLWRDLKSSFDSAQILPSKRFRKLEHHRVVCRPISDTCRSSRFRDLWLNRLRSSSCRTIYYCYYYRTRVSNWIASFATEIRAVNWLWAWAGDKRSWKPAE